MDSVSPERENSNTRRSSSPIKSTPQENHQLSTEHVQSESTPQENHQLGSEHIQSENTPQENRQLGSEYIQSENTTQGNRQLASEHVQSESAPQESHQLSCKLVQNGSVETMLGQESDSTNIKLLELPTRDASKNTRSSCKKTKVSLGSRKRTYMLRSSVGSARVLRSRSCGASKTPVHPVAADGSVNVTAERKKKRKKEKASRKLDDEFSITRKRLRYLLTRMSYEQSLIDAYSGEGWKGQSLEKIKPVKELQRATAEIFRCKQKIRSLFQQIDSSCAEGRLQESLFDSDGQIDCEDISCAKCGSKDLSTDNDIILCDGMCDRGFHQMCLEPPLLKEEIPPEDEGWLCPGCDCKVDCIDLLNDSQETDLSIKDHWEKVFPEAAATVAEDKKDDDLQLPSDDSEDDDYDPDGPQHDGKVQTEDSSSEESDFTSASEDSRALPNDDLYLGLPSDDPEDDDYDPNAPDNDEQVKKESSSSDFNSDSEDFNASGDDRESFGAAEVPESLLSVDDAKSIRGSGERSATVKKKKQSVNSELASLLEAEPNDTLLSGKRNVERLDYKKLRDETYGNVPSDSSDDEDWTEGNASRKGKSNAVGNCTISPNGISSTSMNGPKDIKRNSRETENTPERKTLRKLGIKGANESVHRKHKDTPDPCSSGKMATASPYKTLGRAVTQRLSESLRENRYPDQATKEKLVKELGITLRQVGKWFENARRRLRLSENVGVRQAETTSSYKESILTPSNRMYVGPEPDKDAVNNDGEVRGCSKLGSADGFGTKCYSGNEESRKLATAKSSQKKLATPNGTLPSVNSELQSLLEEDPNVTLLSGKRNVERLDYKKLRDETYGNGLSDSSDDDDWTEGNASRKGKSNAVGNCTISPKGISSTSMNETKDIKRNSRKTENTPERKTRRKLDLKGANESVHRKHKDGPEPCSWGKMATASPSKTLGKAVTQRLSESFRENQYLDQATKEKLVKELGITLRQVGKWFENARRRLRLSENVGVSQAETTSSNKNILTPSNRKYPGPEADKDAVNNVGEDRRFSKLGSADAIGTESRKPATPNTRKRSRGQMNDEKSDGTRIMVMRKKGTREESPRTQTISKIDQNPKQELNQSRIMTRSRKSAA